MKGLVRGWSLGESRAFFLLTLFQEAPLTQIGWPCFCLSRGPTLGFLRLCSPLCLPSLVAVIYPRNCSFLGSPTISVHFLAPRSSEITHYLAWIPFVIDIWNASFPSLLLSSHQVRSNSLRSHGLQYARLPCPSLSEFAHAHWVSDAIPPSISSSAAPLFHLQSFPASGSFAMSWLFISGGRSIELWHQSFQWIFRLDFL